jgi:uncharacterized protein
MSAGIPVHVVASTAIARRVRFEGSLPIARLTRLAGCLASPTGELKVDLQAGTDAGGAPYLRGSVSGDVTLLCQRCLSEFVQPLVVPVNLRLVHSDADEARLMHESEPYQVVGDRLPLQELVEDEVMLALPLAPRCSRPGCGDPGSATGQGAAHPGGHLG